MGRKRVVYSLKKHTLSTSISDNPLNSTEYLNYETKFDYHLEINEYNELLNLSLKFLNYLNYLNLNNLSLEEYKDFNKTKFKWLIKFYHLSKVHKNNELLLRTIEAIIEYYQIQDNNEYSPDTLNYLEEYLQASEFSSNPLDIVKAHEFLGSFYLMKSQDPKFKNLEDLPKAKQHLQQARTEYRLLLDDKLGHSFNNFSRKLYHEILINLGLVYFKSKQNTLAQDIFNLVIDMSLSNSDFENLRKAYANLCILFKNKKDYIKAIEYCELEAKTIRENDLEGIEDTLWDMLDLYIKSKNIEGVQSTCRQLSNLSLDQQEQEHIDNIVNQSRQIQMFGHSFSQAFGSDSMSSESDTVQSESISSSDISQMYLNKCMMVSVTPNPQVINWITHLFDENSNIQANFSGQGWACQDFSSFCSILEYPIPESSISELNLSRNLIDDHCIDLIFKTSKILEILKSLDLSCTMISSKSLLTILKAISLSDTINLRYLNLSFTRIGDQSLLILMKLLNTCSKLSHLILSNTNICFNSLKFNDFIDFKINSNVLEEFHLDLIGNQISDPDILIKWLNIINNFKSITHLNLSFSKCRNWTFTQLWRFFTACTKIQHVDISNNQFSFDSFIENTAHHEITSLQLRHIDLSHTNINNQELKDFLLKLNTTISSRIDIYLIGNLNQDHLKGLLGDQLYHQLNIIV